MSLARLVVIEGPDAGREFELPLRGGSVGRGEGSLVQLTDPTVSRQHGLIELRDGALCWVDDSGKPRTLINGQPAALHRLEAGDEIVLGGTRLAYLPVDGVAVTARVEPRHDGGRQPPAARARPVGDDRARRHLAALAQLGDRLRARGGRRARCGRARRLRCRAAPRSAASARSCCRRARRVAPIAAAVATGESTAAPAAPAT